MISFFCFVHAKKELLSRPKLREADLDADSKETAAMAERVITRHVLASAGYIPIATDRPLQR